MDKEESVYEHVAEWCEPSCRIGTRPRERGGKASGGRFLDVRLDAAQAQEAKESALARGLTCKRLFLLMLSFDLP
jgi:hypothetical protein